MPSAPPIPGTMASSGRHWRSAPATASEEIERATPPTTYAQLCAYSCQDAVPPTARSKQARFTVVEQSIVANADTTPATPATASDDEIRGRQPSRGSTIQTA